MKGMNRKKRNAKYEDLSKLIITAIEEEQFFNKETLVPKVKAILNGFSLNMNQTNYNRIKDPTEYQKCVRRCEALEQEKQFWRNIVKAVDKENIATYYKESEKFQIR